jgi:two-component system capsular synthesis sensor histidine kinase RcsC
LILDLPILRDDKQRTDEAPADAAGQPSTRLRVLVVDDEPSVQNVLVEVLSTMGHRTDTASDVPEAVRKIAESGHDLIITDMKMPHGTGRDVYRAAAERSPGLARRVIFTTGDGESAETRDLVRETGNEILPKPWSIQEMEAAITRALGN